MQGLYGEFVGAIGSRVPDDLTGRGLQVSRRHQEGAEDQKLHRALEGEHDAQAVLR